MSLENNACVKLWFYGYSLVTFPILQQVLQHATIKLSRFFWLKRFIQNGGKQCSTKVEWSWRKCGGFASIQTGQKMPQFLALLPQTRNVSVHQLKLCQKRMNANCMEAAAKLVVSSLGNKPIVIFLGFYCLSKNVTNQFYCQNCPIANLWQFHYFFNKNTTKMYLMEHLDDFEPQWIISNRAERKWPTIAYNMRSKKN